jgi:hypothetical protein
MEKQKILCYTCTERTILIMVKKHSCKYLYGCFSLYTDSKKGCDLHDLSIYDPE